MRSRLTTFILVGMLLGIVVGYACSVIWPDPQTAKTIAGYAMRAFPPIVPRIVAEAEVVAVRPREA